MTPRAVTGVGVVSPIGIGRKAFFEAMRAGARAAAVEGRVEVPGFDATKYLGDKGLRSLDRLTKLLLVAARLALHDAGLKKDGAWRDASPEDVGIVVSNAYGSLEAITELDRVATLEDARYINPSRFPLTVANSAAGYASIWEEIRAVNVSVSDGNCGGLDAVACADVLLEQKRARALLAGGVEAMSDALHVAFDRLGAVGESAARLGEGAAVLVLETAERAAGRRAEVLAEVVGYGTAFSAPRGESALVHASAEAVERATADALKDAGVAAGEIDVVVSGASGLRPFDEAELGGVERVLGKPWIVAPKLALGETLGAGGCMGALAAVAFLRERARGYGLRGSVHAAPRTALVTSLGYYGNASALVIRAPSQRGAGAPRYDGTEGPPP